MNKKTLEHIGEVRLMNCGQIAKIVGWDKGKPIIKFEDGTLVEGKRYENYNPLSEKAASTLRQCGWERNRLAAFPSPVV